MDLGAGAVVFAFVFSFVVGAVDAVNLGAAAVVFAFVFSFVVTAFGASPFLGFFLSSCS